MISRRVVVLALVAALAGTAGAALVVTLSHRLADSPPDAVRLTAVAPTGDQPAAPRLRVSLFFTDADGASLVAVGRDVPLAEPATAQLRAIVQAQLDAEPPPPLVRAVPAGVTVRAVFVTETGDAYLDLDGAALRAGLRGSLEERLAVYALVHAVTVNLPMVSRVQLLLDGHEADTLAGHVDLRQPLGKNEGLIRTP